MNKEITFGKESQNKILEGIDITSNAVGGTIGPKGRNVYVDHATQPKWTNDGATIATNVVLKDQLQNIGAKLVKNACGQTNDDAGDGTTTTAVLVQAIAHEALKRPENAMEIRESLLEAGAQVVKEIKSRSESIDEKDIKKVTLISAENDELATAISEIISKVGKDAVITVEDAYDGKISYDLIEGYEAGVGFMSPAFINQDKRAQCIMTDVPVFVTDKKISAVGDIQPLWAKFEKKGITSCVIVCDDIENSVLGVFVTSKLMGKFNALVIRATGDLLKDIEAATGATRVSDTTGLTFQMVTEQHLGFCKKVISDSNKSLFIPKDPSKAVTYSNHLQKIADDEPNMYIKERLNKRISQLRGGIAVLKIGAPDFEREYLKDKADDAIKASKSALEEGIVEGGGLTLWRIAQNIVPKTIGESILKKALTAPFKKIVENAGKDYSEVLLDIEDNIGFNAKTGEFVNMKEKGIIDPAKVERCAVENAVSNVAQFITGFCSITDLIEDERRNK